MPRTGYIDPDIHLLAGMLTNLGSALPTEEWLKEGPMPGSEWDQAVNSVSQDAAELAKFALFRLPAATDLLYGMASAMTSGSLLAPLALVRPIVEACGHVFWMLEPGLSPERQIARGLGLRKDELKRAKQLAHWANAPAMLDENTTFVKHLNAAAKSSGLKPTKPLSTENATTLIREILSKDRNASRVAYLLDSGLVHMTPLVVHIAMSNVETAALGEERSVPVQALVDAAADAVMCIRAALGCLARCTGRQPTDSFEPVIDEMIRLRDKHKDCETFVDIPGPIIRCNYDN